MRHLYQGYRFLQRSQFITTMPRAKQQKTLSRGRPARKPASVSEPTNSNPAPRDSPDTIYFYRPQGDHGQCSQWWISTFTCNITGKTYSSCEQYMMHRKALLFAPSSSVAAEILSTDDPKTLKALGRMVPDFEQEKWEEERENIVFRGNYLKFTQDEELKRYLLGTGECELVEAAGRDRIWGVGFGVEKARYNRKRWGLNLLGKALMNVRTRIREEGEGREEERI